MFGSATKPRKPINHPSPRHSDADSDSSAPNSSSSDEGEEAGSRFVQKWINRKYPQLGLTSCFNDLNDMFRYHYGKRAKGLREALFENIEKGKMGPVKGSGRNQVFSVAGAPGVVTAASWIISQAGIIDRGDASVVGEIGTAVAAAMRKRKPKREKEPSIDGHSKKVREKKIEKEPDPDSKNSESQDVKPPTSPQKSNNSNKVRVKNDGDDKVNTTKGKRGGYRPRVQKEKQNVEEKGIKEKGGEKRKISKEERKEKQLKVKGKEKKNGVSKLSLKRVIESGDQLVKAPRKSVGPKKQSDIHAAVPINNGENKVVKDKSRNKEENKNKSKQSGNTHEKSSIVNGGGEWDIKNPGEKQDIQVRPEKNLDKVVREISNREKQSVPLKKRLLSAIKEEIAPLKKRRLLDIDKTTSHDDFERKQEVELNLELKLDSPLKKEPKMLHESDSQKNTGNGKEGDEGNGRSDAKRDILAFASCTVPKKRKKIEGDSEKGEKRKKIPLGEEAKTTGPPSNSPKKLKKTIVWAKVLTYPWWPARFADPRHEEVPRELLHHESKTKHSRLVQFYGTLDYLWVPRGGLKDFRSNFKQLSKDIPPEHAPELEPAIEDAYDEYVEKYGKIIDENDAICEVCKSPDDADRMLLCDKCDSGFHIYCLVPPMTEKDIPSTNWYCDDCVSAECDIDARGIVTTSYIAPGTVGLLNLGSSCYVNSFIQCLNSAEAFRRVLLQNMPLINLPTTTPGKRRGNSDGNEGDENGDADFDETDQEAGKEQQIYKRQSVDNKPDEGYIKEGDVMALPSASVTTVNQLPISLGRRNDFILILQAVFYSIWQANGVDRSLLQALRLASGQALAFKYFRSEHQDINEFLMQALEYIHTNHNKSSPNPTISTSPSQSNPLLPPTSPPPANNDKVPSNHSPLKDALQTWQEHVETNPSAVSDMFEGMITRSRTCPQGHVSTSYEIFRILPLQFPGHNPSTSRRGGSSHSGGERILLAGMLDHFAHEEKLWCRCDECGGQDNKLFTQKTEIFKFPPFLVIQLGRFSGVVAGEGDDAQWWSNKITTEVTFPVTSLNMQHRFPNSNPHDPPAVYDLIAIANHKGSVSGGHYYTYAKAKDGTWYNYNDHIVKEIKDTQLVSEFAYMLFYERRPHTPVNTRERI